jgi:hypothetical protein
MLHTYNKYKFKKPRIKNLYQNNNLGFDSKFEKLCGIEICKCIGDDKRVCYTEQKKYFDDKNFTVDFHIVVGDEIFWVESSLYKNDGTNDKYFRGIEKKRKWAHDRGDYFVFLNSPEDVKTFIEHLNKKLEELH